MHDFFNTFTYEDKRYIKLIKMTGQDLNMAIDRLNDIYTRSYNSLCIARNHPSKSGIMKRPLLPFGNLVLVSRLCKVKFLMK